MAGGGRDREGDGFEISNGILQGRSSLVQATQSRAGGFRSTRNLVAMINLMHGKLPNSQPTETSEERRRILTTPRNWVQRWGRAPRSVEEPSK